MTAILLVAGPALADAGDTNDVRALEQQLAEEHAALSTADCNAACRALMSIRRAADKICALEPGPRCDAAREKATDATRRVREACPDCMIAATPEPAPERAATGAEETVHPASAPREEAARGGCRSCSATGSGGSLVGDLGAIALAAFAAVRLGRRRSRNARS